MSSGDLISLVGRTVAGFRIERSIGAGGMGTVFLAVHPKLGRRVAVKVLPPALTLDREVVRRFKREARTLRRLKHPNIIGSYGVFRAQGLYGIAMEPLVGSAAELLARKGPLPETVVASIGRDAALGLAAAAEVGIVHRDVKPENLLLALNGRAKVADFGLARAAEQSVLLTKTATAMGTPPYMPPEQWQDSRQADHRSDLYSLGCTLYHLATGELPFAGPAAYNYFVQHMSTPPPDLRERRPELSPAFSTIVRRLLAKRREDRFVSGADLAAALEPLADAGEAAVVAFAAFGRPTASALAPPSDESPGATRAPDGPEPGAPSAWGSAARQAIEQAVDRASDSHPERRALAGPAPAQPPAGPPPRARRSSSGEGRAVGRPSLTPAVGVLAALVASAVIALAWALGRSPDGGKSGPDPSDSARRAPASPIRFADLWPGEGDFVADDLVAVRGRVEGYGGARVHVHVNGRPVRVRDDGSFGAELALPEGMHEVSFSASAEDGAVGRAVRRFSVDRTAPRLEVEPVDALVRDPHVVLRGRVKDASPVTVTIDGSATEVRLDGFSDRSPRRLAEGENLFEVVARDRAGHETRVRRRIFLDLGRPKLALEVAGVAGAKGAEARVRGHIADADASYVLVAGRRVEVQAGGRFEVRVPLPEGATTIEVDAFDRAGNAVGARAYPIGHDSLPPVLRLEPLPREVPPDEQVVFAGDVDEDGCSFVVGGLPVGAIEGRKFRFSQALFPGAWVYRPEVVVRDAAGNETKVAVGPLRYDLPLPPGLEQMESGEYRSEKDGAVMVFVPAGRFIVGYPEDLRVLQGASFFIDKREVTRLQYDRYLRAVFKTTVAGVADDRPMTGVSWEDAARYATWAGKRLPTELEWERAARGFDARRFPWGNEPPEPDRAVWAWKEGPKPVGSAPRDRSPFGCLDLGGNVSEWCADWDRDGYYAARASAPESGKRRVVRGGSYGTKDPLQLSVFYRGSGLPGATYGNVGFRCARSR